MYRGVRHVYTPRRPSGPTPTQAAKGNGPTRPSNARSRPEGQTLKPTEPPRKPRDEEIRYRRVRLVDPDTGSLGPLTILTQVLELVRNMPVPPTPGGEEQATDASGKKEKWWKKKWCVELVSEAPDPIVRAVNLSGEYRKAKEAQKKKREGVIKEKGVQMSWSVAQGDLEHKLKKVKETLEEGERVVIGFSRKKGQPWPKPDEMQAKLRETVDQLADIAEEWKPRVTLPNSTGFIYIQSKE